MSTELFALMNITIAVANFFIGYYGGVDLLRVARQPEPKGEGK